MESVCTCDNPRSPGLNIIYIHGVAPSASDRQSTMWKENLPRLSPSNSNVWGYDLETELGDQFKTMTFLEKSTKLLNAIYTLHEETRKEFRPVVFCCHGLGGVLLKKALWKARERFAQFSELLEYISGVIFLATPHFTKNTTSGSTKLANILRLPSNFLDSEPAYAQGTLSNFEFVSEHFEEMRMKIPILSCFEGKPKNLKRWWSKNQQQLVDSDLAKVSAEKETFIRIDSNLQVIFDKIDLPVHLSIAKFLLDILNRDPERIKKEFRPLGGGEENFDRNSSLGSTSLADFGRISLGTTEESNFSVLNAPRPLSSPSNIPKTSPELVQISPSLRPASVSVKLPCHYFEPYTEAYQNFEGRTDVLKEIYSTFHEKPEASKPDGLRTFTIWGSRGVGKTQVAVAYMFSQKSFYDAIFWIPAGDSVKIAQAFNQIALRLGLITLDQQQEDAEYSLSLVHAWLSNPCKPESQTQLTQENATIKKARWLMIFDNADQPDIIYRYFPKNGQGFVLITGQQQNKNHFGISGLKLSPLSLIEADSLFRKLMDFDYDPNPEEVKEIVETLSCFPLAIFLMAGIIRTKGLPLTIFLKQYKKDDIRGLWEPTTQSLISDNQSPPLYNQTLSSIWSIYNLEPEPARILAIMAFLDPDYIQAEIFTTEMDKDRPLGLPTSYEDYYSSLGKLLALNIITRLERKDQSKVFIHRIVQDTIRAQIYSEEDYFREIFAATVHALSSIWPFVLTQKDGSYPLYGRVKRWEKCAMVLPHIESLRQLFELEKDKLRYGTLAFAMLVTEAAIYLYERGNQNDSTVFVDSALKIQDNCNNEDTKEIRSALFDIKGSIAMTTNKPEAAMFYQYKALRIEEDKFDASGVVTARLASAYSELGRAKLMSGLIQGVEDDFKKSAEFRKRLPKYDELQDFNPQRGLAMVHCFNENWDEAIRILENALKVREKRFGPNDKEGGRTGALLYYIGNAKYGQGSMTESMEFHKRALNQIRSTQGPGHLNAAHACYKLAVDHIDRGGKIDYLRAIELLDCASEVYSKDGSHKPELARVTFRHGFALLMIGEIKKGEEELKNAWEIRQSFVHDSRSARGRGIVDYDQCVEFWTR